MNGHPVIKFCCVSGAGDLQVEGDVGAAEQQRADLPIPGLRRDHRRDEQEHELSSPLRHRRLQRLCKGGFRRQLFMLWADLQPWLIEC